MPRQGVRNQQIARAGEYFVAAELNKRGAFAVTFAGNMPRIDLIACNQDQSRTIHIQVKTKRGGRTWHSSIVGCEPMEPPVAVGAVSGATGDAQPLATVTTSPGDGKLTLPQSRSLCVHGAKPRSRRTEDVERELDRIQKRARMGSLDG